ncbi:aminoacyl tRNA synthase complex-interacting multifunctional protein 1-like isoform X3 [Epinephelus moara]|uniref:aminoacyl tRNA synthase complex-interacting multifunctional protein 1-like isoform X3 n=1 Tax=Epinephelus moara TaxID=300413 RepID=UPI00214EE2BD|nr:aminoacyl tRNA synthase complex-interacting multifunctional protein 1-like isoform X3 [Epinephelus moara]
MDNADNLFHPSLAAALMKLDPEDGEQIMEYFKTHALLTREKALLQASVRDQKKLLVENAKALFSLAPSPPTVNPAPTTPVDQPPSPAGATAAVPSNAPPPSSHDHRDRHSRRRRGDRKARPSSDSFSLEVEPRVDVSRLDLRVGRILSVRQHPLTDAMSVQEVDVGENAPRTVVSKLGVKTNQVVLQGSLAVLLCNVKSCKLRGVVSQARLLCCSTSDDHTELLTPPTGSTPGDRITFLNYPGDPDRELQSKQRVWELLQPDLQVDSKGVANYMGCGFEVKGKGLCRAPTLTNCAIR